MKITADAFAYRADPHVPPFEDEGAIVVMDAECGLCAKGARWIARNDSQDEFRIVPVQSPLGQALLIHFGLDPDDPVSWLYLKAGRCYTSLDAIIRVGNRLGGVWRGLAVFRVMPRWLQDGLYGFVARKRYRIGGRVEMCSLKDPEIERRMMT